MPLRYGLGLGLVVLVALFATIAQAQAAPTAAESEEQARAHFRLGRAHYDNGNFAQAAVEFEEAYRISQRAALLYNIYLAYRDANDVGNAAEALRKYLALEKNIENRGQLEARLTALDRSLKESPTPAVATSQPPAANPGPAESLPPETAAPTVGPAPEAAVAPAEARASRPFPILPVALMAGGGAMVIGSVITGVMAQSKSSEWAEARDACNERPSCTGPTAAQNDLKSSGQTLATVTDILLFGGIAVAGTGVVLLILDLGRSEQATPSASVACVPGACGAAVRGRF